MSNLISASRISGSFQEPSCFPRHDQFLVGGNHQHLDPRLRGADDGFRGAGLPVDGKIQHHAQALQLAADLLAETPLVFPNPRRELLPGMFVRAIVNEGVNEQAILAPQKGVTRNVRGEPTALVLGEGNKVELRILKTDRAIGDKWLVTDGLKAGDRLIVEGLQKIGPGAEVRPVEITGDPAK